MNAPRLGATTYATPTDTELVCTRLFDAPRHLVFAAWTEPRHLQQWLLGPEGWTMPDSIPASTRALKNTAFDKE